MNPKQPKTVLQKSTFGGLSLSDSKTYFKSVPLVTTDTQATRAELTVQK